MPSRQQYNPSVRMSQVKMSEVKTSLLFWIGPFALASLVLAAPADAQTKEPAVVPAASNVAASPTPTVKPSTRYSAARARTRKAALARARAAAAEKELVESVPRYKTDASGAVVPDL